MNSTERIHRLKTLIFALISLGLGIGLLVLSRYVESTPSLDWLALWPLAELGGILTGAGLLGIGYDYIVDRDKDALDDERLRKALEESAPYFRDAVVKGFAASPDDLKAVATPELLDAIGKNALGLRLGDSTFAAELYEGLRDQAIRAPERWHDAQVRIRLSELSPAGERNAHGVPLFSILVQWEYTVVPSKSVQKFACTSDREEFRDLISDIPSTSTWFMTPRPGLRANDRACFELLQFAVDGQERKIRRSERKTGQTYAVTIGDDIVAAGQPVRITHTYRTVTARASHRLFLAVAQPTKDLSVTLDYTDTDIAELGVTNLVSAAKRARVLSTPKEATSREVTIDVPGWLLPPAEVSYVWTLANELPTSDTPEPRSSDAA